MAFLKLKIYKYPVFIVFLSFWAGIFLSPYGWYGIIGFVFGLILLKYTLGSDILYPAIFFLSGFLYVQPENRATIEEGRVAIRGTVVGKGVVQVDSVIGEKKSYLKGKKLYVRGLSGFENGDIIEAMVNVKNKRPLQVATIIKIRKKGRNKNILFSLNRYLKQKIEELSDIKEVQGFMLGVLLGYRDFIPNTLMNDFKKTGTMHILALSGLHIGILVTFIYFIVMPLAGHRNPALIIASIVVLLYMLVIGTSPSVFRAYLLLTVTALIKITRRRTSLLNALGIAGLFSLILYPSWAFSYSFMLSYLAVYGILAFSHLSTTRYGQYVLASLGAVLYTLPITAHLSGYFPIFSFLFNLIVIPLFGITLSIFFTVLLLYIVFPPLLPVYTTISNLVGGAFLKVVHVLTIISPILKINLKNPVSITLYYLALLSIPVIISILKKGFFKKQEVLIESS